MLIIRQAQFAALEQATLERWFVGHLDSHFPELREKYPGEEHRQFIRNGVLRAKARGFTTGPQVAQWLNLMVLLGPNFDEDPANPWVTPILREREPASVKILNLLDAAEQKVWGAVEK